jgi:hypothetical protein
LHFTNHAFRSLLALSIKWLLQAAMANREEDEQSSSSSEGVDLDTRLDLETVYTHINVINIDLQDRL